MYPHQGAFAPQQAPGYGPAMPPGYGPGFGPGVPPAYGPRVGPGRAPGRAPGYNPRHAGGPDSGFSLYYMKTWLLGIIVTSSAAAILSIAWVAVMAGRIDWEKTPHFRTGLDGSTVDGNYYVWSYAAPVFILLAGALGILCGVVVYRKRTDRALRRMAIPLFMFFSFLFTIGAASVFGAFMFFSTSNKELIDKALETLGCSDDNWVVGTCGAKDDTNVNYINHEYSKTHSIILGLGVAAIVCSAVTFTFTVVLHVLPLVEEPKKGGKFPPRNPMR